MALHILLPSCFDFSKPKTWEGCIARFEHFCSIAGLRNTKDATTNKSDTFLYPFSWKVNDVVRSFSLTVSEVGNYTVIKEKFNACFNICRNVIYERVKFNSRVQLSGQPIDDFLISLYSLTS